MKRVLLWLALFHVEVATAQESSALVTFYSAGCQPCGKEIFQGTVAGSFERAYVGNIYDGSERLAHISTHRFVTFKLPSGTHTFDVEDAVKHPSKQKLSATLDSGRHYFIRMSILDRGVYAFRVLKPSLDFVDCSVASSESAKLKPVEPNKLKVKALRELMMTPSFPACEELQK